uniref:Uncharacterized protein n=1 Tax=Ditylenchus dipsaci TaxID=166011 RepID=A0A915E1G0_9BILA
MFLLKARACHEKEKTLSKRIEEITKELHQHGIEHLDKALLCLRRRIRGQVLLESIQSYIFNHKMPAMEFIKEDFPDTEEASKYLERQRESFALVMDQQLTSSEDELYSDEALLKVLKEELISKEMVSHHYYVHLRNME